MSSVHSFQERLIQIYCLRQAASSKSNVEKANKMSLVKFLVLFKVSEAAMNHMMFWIVLAVEWVEMHDA